MEDITDNGTLYISANDPILEQLDENTKQQYEKDGKIRIVQRLPGETDNGTALTDAMSMISAEVPQGNYRGEFVLQALEKKLETELLNRMYPGHDQGVEGVLPTGVKDTFDGDEVALINTIRDEILTELKQGRNDESSDYYVKDGVFVNQMKWQDNWFSRWGADATEREALRTQQQIRKAKIISSEGNAWETTSIFTAKQLINARSVRIDRAGTKRVGPEEYLSNDFIKAALDIGVNPWKLYQAQRGLLSKDEQAKVPKVTEPSAVQKLKFTNAELKTLGMLLDDGTGRINYFRLNKAASRVLNQKLRSLIQGDDERRFRPDERKLLKVLGKQSLDYQEGNRIGKYAMAKEDVVRILSEIKPEFKFNLNKFLTDADLQRDVANAHMLALTNKAYGDGKVHDRSLGGQLRSAVNQITGVDPLSFIRKNYHLKDAGPIVRQILHDWKGLEYDPQNPLTYRELNEYRILLGGGTL